MLKLKRFSKTLARSGATGRADLATVPESPPPLRRGRFFLALGAALFALPAAAQTAPAPAAAQPLWLTALLGLLPMVIGAVLALKPLLKLADWLHARALDQGRSAVARLGLLAGESLSKSVEHFLEATGADYSDLATPEKRAAALAHLKAQAEAGALPAVTDAAKALGSSWLAGAASSAVDAAAAKADGVVQQIMKEAPAQKLGDAVSRP